MNRIAIRTGRGGGRFHISLLAFIVCAAAGAAIYICTMAQVVVSEGYRDNIQYSTAYALLAHWGDIRDQFQIFRLTCGAGEPGAFLLFRLSAPLVSYETYTYIINLIIVSSLGAILYFSLRIPGLVLFIIACFTDYYLLLDLAEIQRLKIALLFPLFAVLLVERRWLRYLIMACGGLFHLQTLLLVVVALAYDLLRDTFARTISWRNIFVLSVGVLATAAVLYGLREGVERKIAYYSAYGGAAWQPALVAVAYIFYLLIQGASINELLVIGLLAAITFVASLTVGESRLFFYIYECIIFNEFRRLIRGKWVAIIPLMVMVCYNALRFYTYIYEVRNPSSRIKYDALDYLNEFIKGL